MVAQRTEAVAEKELVLSDEVVEVDVGTDARPTSRLIFPPIPRLLQDADSPATEVDASGERDHALWNRAEAELERLLRRYAHYRDSPAYLAKASRLALACGRPEAARQLAAEAVPLAASDRTLRYRLAEALAQSQEPTAARSIFVELAESGHLLSCLRLCELEIRSRNHEAASRWLAQASEIDEGDWRVQMIAGMLALVGGAFEQAVRHFRNSLDDRPRSVRLHYDLALAHVLTGHPKNAMTAFRKAVALGPFQRRTLMAWADLSAHLGTGLAEVAGALSRYLSIEPDDKPTIERLASVLRQHGDNVASYRILASARRFNDPRLSNNLGVLAAERKDLRLAVREFSKAAVHVAEREGEYDRGLRSTATANLMGSLIEARSFTNAIGVGKAFVDSVDLAQLLGRDPEYRVADGLVESLLESRRFEAAVELAENWINSTVVEPRLEAALAEKLVCYYTLEKVDNDRAYMFAKRGYDVQSAIEPSDPVRLQGAINNLAYASIELERYAEAAAHLGRMHPPPDGNGAFAHATRGLLAIRLGQLEKGTGLYRRAISQANRRSKNQLRKKLQWELALYWRKNHNLRKSKMHLTKMLETRSGSAWQLDHLDRRARALLRRSGQKRGRA